MGDWSAIVPVASTNEVTDPSFEAATLTTCWTNSSMTTFEKSTTRAFRGYNSLHAVSDNAGDYVYGNEVANADAGEVWTASCWVWVVAGDFKLTVQQNNAGYTDHATHGETTTTGRWVYVTTTVTLAAGVTDARIKLGPHSTAASEFYVDCVQLEQQATATTYVDGEEPGCTWAGAAHASASSRSAQYRGGGTVVDIDATYSVYTTAYSGFGMPALKHNALEYALLPGGSFQSSKVQARELILSFGLLDTTTEGLHSKRKDLLDLFKPDLVSPEQPVRLRYAGAGTAAVEIDAYYRDGLEGAYDAREEGQERLAARFVCYDPFWYELGHGSAVLDGNLTVTEADDAIKRVAGVWSAISTALNGPVYAFAVGPDGSLYLGGSFTNVGDANGDRIVKVSPSGAVSSLGTGAADVAVLALAVAPNGDLYAGGSFSAMGGVANTESIARWDGTQWNAVGTGISGIVYALCFGSDGILYIGGDFTNHGDASGDYVTSWTGAAYASLGTGCQQTVRALALASNGDIYATGDFTGAGGVSNTAYIARWDGTTWNALSTGLDANGGNTLAVGPDGTVYVGGSNFTAAGGVSCAQIASWNGSTFAPLGSGLNGTGCFALHWSEADRLLYVGGGFTTAGDMAVDYAAIWNGTTWGRLPADLPSTATTRAVASTPAGNLYLGYETEGNALTANQTTVTNSGTRTAYPILKISRTGGTSARLEYLKNETTGQTVWFDYALLSGETVTIDLDYRTDPTKPTSAIPGRKRITSSMFGDVIGRALLQGSDLAGFGLAPGANTISLYVSEAGSPTVTAVLTWRQPHWGADGVAS